MPRSNLLNSLEKRLAKVRGEILVINERIDAILAGYATVPELEAKLEQLRANEETIRTVILMEDGDWSDDQVLPKRPYSRRVAGKHGECSRHALLVLRDASRPMTNREIGDAVLDRLGVEEPDVDERTFMANCVGSALRGHQKRGVRISTDDGRPKRWWMSQTPPSLGEK